MKKLLAVILLTALLCSFCATAFASEGEYKNTRSFLSICDENGIKYTYKGLDEKGNDIVLIDNQGDDSDFDYTIRYYFDKDGDLVALRVWYIIEYAEKDYYEVLETCNALNKQWKYVKLYADTEDNTVSADMDIMLPGDGYNGELIWDATLIMVNLLDQCYKDLKPLDH